MLTGNSSESVVWCGMVWSGIMRVIPYTVSGLYTLLAIIYFDILGNRQIESWRTAVLDDI